PPYDKVLWNLFCQVDTDGSGAISPKELSGALINGNFTPFDIVTVQLMVRMFDEDRSGTISFAEFAKLWAYLLEWKQLFARFDTDASGTISFIEFSDALAAFGYRLSIEFAQFLFRHHERDRKQRTKEMTFDLFVQACITLRSYTDIFKAFDTDQDGVITIGFEDFLRVLIKNR
ncbi:programmed cell death protein 6-like protein, partial [Protomyces lactucae-debilis]